MRDFLSLCSSFEVVEHGKASGAREVSFYDAPFAPPNLRDEASPWRALFACCEHVDTCRELNALFRRSQERDAHGDTIYFVSPDVEETPIQPGALSFPPCADPRVRLTLRRKHDPSDLLSFREFTRVYSDFVLVEDGAAKALHQISLYEAPYPGPRVDGKPNPWRALYARCGDMRTCRKLELLYQKVRLVQDGYWATRTCGPPHPDVEETPIAPEVLEGLPSHLPATAACTRIRSCQEALRRGHLECEYARPAELDRCAAKDDCADVLTCAVELDQTIQPRRPIQPQPRKPPPEVLRTF